MALLAAVMTVAAALVPGASSSIHGTPAQASPGPHARLVAVADGDWGVTCHQVTFPVALAPGAAAQYTVAGQLCATPAELGAGSRGVVQVLEPGATYNDYYFNLGVVDGVEYSWARDMAAAGIPTFGYDPIGTGGSSHPPSTDITVQAAADVAHQVISDLHEGAIGGTRFATVIEVGHSIGSIVASLEAATWHDVAGLILTGDLHSTPAFADVAFADSSPAADDPRFAGSGLDPGYLTTRPGTRGTLYYSPEDADPKVIALDESLKDVVSVTELAGALALQPTTMTLQISVPVLLIDGANDQLDCGPQAGGGSYSCTTAQAVAQQEGPFYAPAAQLRACIIPAAGHDVALSLNHQPAEADAVAWTLEYIDGLRSRILPADCSS